MPTVNQYLAEIRKRYPLVQVDDALLNELRRREGEGSGIESVLTDAASYYQTQAGPFDIFEKVRKAGSEGFARRRAQNAADFADTEERLRQNAKNDTSAFEERQSNLGLLRSGLTAAGSGKIASDLTKNIGRADIQRSIADADLALKEAGFNADLGSQTINMSKNLYNQDLGTSKFVSDLLQSPSLDSIPDNILRQILEQLGYTVTA